MLLATAQASQCNANDIGLSMVTAILSLWIFLSRMVCVDVFKIVHIRVQVGE